MPTSPADREPPGGRRLGVTRPYALGVAAAVGAVGSLVLVAGAQRLNGSPPVLPWSGPLVVLFAAAVVAGLAFTTWRRIQVRLESIEPQRAIRFLALGKASALGGAAIAAGYLVFVAVATGNLQAAGPQQRLVRGLVAAAAGVALSAAGLWLERACRIPTSMSDEDSEELPQ